MTRHARRLLGRFRKQSGFTLIEMLVVISILAVLAAVVSLAMVGVTNLAQKRANDGELLTVQSALDFMIMDQQIDPAAACAGSPAGGTSDMSKFPNGTDGTRSSTGVPVRLYDRYLRTQFTNRAYVCTTGGGVRPATG
jgi:prepilin-type N-terminal cleavage/methylation domain-containing protein